MAISAARPSRSAAVCERARCPDRCPTPNSLRIPRTVTDGDQVKAARRAVTAVPARGEAALGCNMPSVRWGEVCQDPLHPPYHDPEHCQQAESGAIRPISTPIATHVGRSAQDILRQSPRTPHGWRRRRPAMEAGDPIYCTLATTAVMLSRPPLELARSMRRRQHISEVTPAPRVTAISLSDR